MFDVSGNDLNAFERDLDYILGNMQRESKIIMKKMGLKAKKIVAKKARQLIKKKTGNYHKRWKLGKVWKDDEGSYKIRVYNNSPHAHLIENGHRIVSKDGRELGFKQGYKVIDKANNELESKWHEELKKELDKLVQQI